MAETDAKVRLSAYRSSKIAQMLQHILRTHAQ